MSGKRKSFGERLEASALAWTPGGRRLIQEIYAKIGESYTAGMEDGKAIGFVAGVQEREYERGI